MGFDCAQRVYLYGLDVEYRLVHCYYIPFGLVTASELAITAKQLKYKYPSVCNVYAVDNGHMIYRAYMELLRDNSLENRVAFKLMLQQYGFEIGLA